MTNKDDTPNPHEAAFLQFIKDVTDIKIGDKTTLARLAKDLHTEALKLAWSFYEDLMDECQEEDPYSLKGFSQWDYEVRFAIFQELRSFEDYHHHRSSFLMTIQTGNSIAKPKFVARQLLTT